MLIEVEIEIRCAECGKEMEAKVGRFPGELVIYPCSACEETAKETAHDDGYTEGYDAGRKDEVYERTGD